MEYKINHARENWEKVCIRECRPTRSDAIRTSNKMQLPPRLSLNKSVPENKIQALKSMFKWMPEVDQAYHTAIFSK